MNYNIEYHDPILVCALPEQIMEEVNEWVEECRKAKDSPLTSYKSYWGNDYDIGNTPNFYRCPVPTHLVENSFWLAYTLKLCAEMDNTVSTNYKLPKTDGHYNGYNIWANFSGKGSYVPTHKHDTTVSGIIYAKNHNHPTYFPEKDIEYMGDVGTMILFPSNTLHSVNQQEEDEERITISFNISKVVQVPPIPF